MSEDTLICPLCGEAITVQGHTCGVVRGGGVLQLMDVGDYITKRLADLPFLVGRINQLEQAFLKLTTMHDNVACLACELAEALETARDYMFIEEATPLDRIREDKDRRMVDDLLARSAGLLEVK